MLNSRKRCFLKLTSFHKNSKDTFLISLNPVIKCFLTEKIFLDQTGGENILAEMHKINLQ